MTIKFKSKCNGSDTLQDMNPNWMIAYTLTLMIAQNLKVQELFVNQESENYHWRLI
jgi:hypothetical protein